MIGAREGVFGAATKRSLAWALAFVALTACSAIAQTIPVYPGCDVPRPSERGRTFYIDPVHGSPTNDGSKERPWRTLAEVVDPANHLIATRSYIAGPRDPRPIQPINPSGSIRPGDTLVLMSGDHGAVEMRSDLNDDFIWVVAGPDQTPVIDSMKIYASSHWVFRGVKFQGIRPENDPWGGLIEVVSHNWMGPSDNIVFVGNSFSTADESESWTPEDWVNKPFKTGFGSSGFCTALVDNHFFNVRDAASIGGDRTLAQGNLIERMGNDGIDIAASDLIIRGNVIRDGRNTPTEPLHPDGIQGWTAPGVTNRNVVIEGNKVINVNPSDDNTLQGIDIFDGHWDGVTVVNNVVVTNHWHGIALYGVDDARVINNTVVPAQPDKFPSWIMIHDNKDKTPSRHVVVRNNIAAQLIVDAEDVSFDHNIAQKRISANIGGRAPVELTRGGIGDHNFIDGGVFGYFVDYGSRTGHFDLRPTQFSPAAGAGAADGAPPFDIAGKARTPPIDIGAYAR